MRATCANVIGWPVAWSSPLIVDDRPRLRASSPASPHAAPSRHLDRTEPNRPQHCLTHTASNIVDTDDTAPDNASPTARHIPVSDIDDTL